MKRIILLTIFVLSFYSLDFGQEIKCETQPELLDEYPNSSGGSEKHRMQGFVFALSQNPKCDGVIRLQSSRNEEILRQYKKIQKAFVFLGLSFDRITFTLITNSKEEKVEFWLGPPKTDIPNCEECIIIRANDFPKIEALFKPTAKKRKK
jgi:hypothetical protein